MATSQGRDIVAELLHDHEQVKAMFGRAQGAPSSRRSELFCELTNELVRHEVAEEIVVYPEARQRIPNGERLADARIKEQAKAEELLDTMEKAGPEDPGFPDNLEKLQKAVLAHAEKEEELIFAPLRQALDADERAQMGELFRKVKAAGPTHPHPHAPDTPPGNVVLGPITALVDKARDAMQRIAS